MSSAIMSKVWNLFGMDQADVDDEEENAYDDWYDEERDRRLLAHAIA